MTFIFTAPAVECLYGAPSLPHESPGIVRLNAEGKVHVPGLADFQPLNMAALHHITPSLRVANAPQGVEHTPTQICATHFDSP